MTGEQRLDAMIETLGRGTPTLDEITRARVAARLEAAIASLPPARPALRGRVITLVAGEALAVAATIAITTWAVSGDELPRSAAVPAAPPALVAQRSALDGPAALAAESRERSEMRMLVTGEEHAPIVVGSGESRDVALAGAAVTVFGPGRLDPTPGGATTDAAAVFVDRSRGDARWSLVYHRVEVIATHATFAVDRGPQARVTVMRGEIVLRCPSGDRRVRSGESASCAAPPRAPRPTAATATATATAPAAEPTLRSTVDWTIARAPARAERPPAGAIALALLPSPPPPPEPPAPPDTDLRIVVSLQPSGEGNAADDALGRLAALYPEIEAARTAYRRGDRAIAEQKLHDIVDARPATYDAALALYELARLAIVHGSRATALDYLDRIDHHPQRGPIAVQVARLREEATALRSP